MLTIDRTARWIEHRRNADEIEELQAGCDLAPPDDEGEAILIT